MKKQSVDVLDEADSFERKLRWLDFKSEQTRLLAYDPDAEWNVGDPMHDEPTHHGIQGVIATVHSLTDFHDYAYDPEWGGYSTKINNQFSHFCEDCEVFTPFFEEQCWFCELSFENTYKVEYKEKSLSRLWISDYDSNEYRFIVETQMTRFNAILSAAFAEMRPALRRTSEQLALYASAFQPPEGFRRGLNIDFMVFDEANGYFDYETSSFYMHSSAVVPYEPFVEERLWYQANPQVDIELAPRSWYREVSEPVLRGVDFHGDTQVIVWPENVSMEPSVPLPGPIFPTPNWEVQQRLTAGPVVDQWIEARSRRNT